MLNIIHFSQDFRQDKSQLGAFSRIFNLTLDGNRHIIFTVHYGDESIVTYPLQHLEIISFGIGNRLLYGKHEWLSAMYVRQKIATYLESHPIPVDLFFGHSQLINYNILRYLQKRFKKPLFWEANIIWGLPLHLDKLLGVKLYRFMTEMLIFQQCDHIVSQTEASKQVIKKAYSIPSEKITVITNSVNLEQFKNKKHYQNKIADQPLKVFFVGRFDKLNGLDFLLDHLNEFSQNGIVPYLLGEGNQHERIVQLHQAGKLVYLGTAPYQQMPERFLEADVLLIPRMRCFLSDLFIPTKLLEAMACGLIVLGSDVGGIKEVIRDGVNGVLFNAGNSKDMIAQILKIRSLGNAVQEQISEAAILEIETRYNQRANRKLINDAYRTIL